MEVKVLKSTKKPVYTVVLSLLFLSALYLIGIIFAKKSLIYQTKKLFINNHPFNIELADTDTLRSRGLSGRNSLSPNSGMLFIFPTAGYYQFWMKEMEFPLDFIWINNDTIVDLTENVPPPDNNYLPTYSSNSAVDKVLEVNAGTIKSLNIVIGDKIKY